MRTCDNSWQRIGYEAKQASLGNAINPGRSISFLRNEPTWGDTNKIIDVIMALSPTN